MRYDRIIFPLIVLVAIARGEGVPTTQPSRPLSAEERAIQTLKKRGVFTDGRFDRPGMPISWVSITMWPQDVLAELKHIKSLRSISICTTEISDAGLKELACLSELTTLRISGPMTNDGLQQLISLKKLTTVEFSGEIDDEGARIVSQFKNLRTVRIWAQGITNDGMNALLKLEHLEMLDLTRSSVTNAGLKELKNAPNLFAVMFAYTRVSDDGMAALAECPKLQRLDLTGTRVSDAGLKHLEMVKTLRHLGISETDASPDGVAALLKSIPSLRMLAISRSADRSDPPFPRNAQINVREGITPRIFE